MEEKNLKEALAIIFKEEQGELSMEQAVRASNNRVLYVTALSSRGILARQITEEGEKWLEKLRRTLLFIEQILEKEVRYLIVKTYKFFPYITYDVDVYVDKNTFQKTITLFVNNGATATPHDGSLGGRIEGAQINIHKPNLLQIDLHCDFTWQKRKYLDLSLLNNSVKRTVAGVEVQTPIPEVEILLCFAETSHEKFFITLADLILVKNLSKEVKSWNIIYDQVRNFGWYVTFSKIAQVFNGYTEVIFGHQLVPTIKAAKIKEHNLPYLLPIFNCWYSYLQNLLTQKKFPLVSFMYFHYTRLMHLLDGQMPYYSHWSRLLKS